ncbi:methyltransferase domain-containing protein [Candidatus Peregrinibacteria bacterium]|nr:methyltransferase domain-containing protein [Candidatus Peregrinibacteria bacterium]
MNSDTVVQKSWLKELWGQAEGNKKLMLQPKILTYKSSKIDCVAGKYLWPGFGVAVGRGQEDRGQFGEIIRGEYANGTCLMVNKEWFFDLGGFDEWYKYFYEDVDLQLRAKRLGGSAVGVMKSVIEHKGSLSFNQNVASDEVVFYYRRNRLVTVLKNFSGGERWLRWGLLVGVSLVSGRLKMSVKAMLMSLDWLMGEVFVRMRLREARQVVKKKSIQWLDLGCGDGKLVKMANEWGIKAMGIDEKKGEKIEAYEANRKYEVISMYHVLEHIKDPVKQLKRIKKWLKPGGVLVLEVPLTGNLSEKWLKKDYLAYWDKTHVNFWTKDEFLKVINKAGYKVIRKGLVWHQVFFHNITAKLGRGVGQVFVGVLLWPWLKLLSIFGFNDEMMRVYLIKV